MGYLSLNNVNNVSVWDLQTLNNWRNSITSLLCQQKKVYSEKRNSVCQFYSRPFELNYIIENVASLKNSEIWIKERKSRRWENLREFAAFLFSSLAKTFTVWFFKFFVIQQMFVHILFTKQRRVYSFSDFQLGRWNRTEIIFFVAGNQQGYFRLSISLRA